MKQFVIIGLGTFGYQVAEELSGMGVEIIIMDKDKILIEKLKDKVNSAYIVDVSDEESIKKLIPAKVDAAIIDLGNSLEVSILVTNYLKNMSLTNIIVKAYSKKQGEILKMVGATKVVYPDREAAKQITPLLVSDTLYKFVPISSGLVMAEIFVPPKYIGKTLIESNIRATDNINIVAIKKGKGSEYSFFVPDYRLTEEDILLAVGEDESIKKFTSVNNGKSEKSIGSFWQKMFGNKE